MPSVKKQTDMVTQLFKEIQSAFPHLEMKLGTNHPKVDLSMDIPKQKGLKFDIHLNLQGDELHLVARHFWLEWFPCTDKDVVKAFREAVHGVLSGEFRILEYYRGRRPVKAELQQPSGDAWKTIGTWSKLSLPFPSGVTTKELRNAPGVESENV